MSTFRRLMSVILVLTMALSIAAMIAGCKKEEGTHESTGQTVVNEAGTYMVNIKTVGGMAMSGIDVYVYEGSDMQGYGQTDENGTAKIDLPAGTNYKITLSGVPKGYEVAESYAFSGTTASIVLKSSLITGESMSGANLGLGDVMYDFSVTTPDGETITLSEVLAEKEVAVLNYWYTTCSACITEFPYMQQAYEMYEDSVAIFAIDPLDAAGSVETFQAQYGLTFPMASVSSSWTTAFNVAGANVDAYPTTIIVDRYGVICMIEEGALVNLRYWTSLFDHFTGDDYEQKLVNTVDDLLTKITPDCAMPSSDEIGAVINNGEIDVTFRPEEDDEYSWPFVITEKNGEACIMASNQEIDDSYAIMYADIYLEAGQAVGLDYLASTEHGGDILHIIVDDNAIFTISGHDEDEQWKTCYPCVADADGYYEVALCYIKDSDTSEGDDTVYLKNLRIVDVEDIDTATYIPREAAVYDDDDNCTYAEIVYNEKDGYYHVGSENGPLLLADLMNYSQFSEEVSIWEMVYNNKIVLDGHDYYDELVEYCNYASNSNLYGICTVNKELAELLKIVDQIAGYDTEDDNEWLKICKYYQAYGTKEQLTDPIEGLATFSAPEAVLGTGVSSNYFYYNRIIMPRGMLKEFTPTKSGVYRITSHSESQQGVEAWIFDENHQELLCYAFDERMFNDALNVSMVYYMEAGKSYYIDIAFWDPYEVGYIPFDIEYVAASYNLFRVASPSNFTYDTNATGEAMYHLIAGGIDVVYNKADGYYHEDLGKDANGNQLYGSILYADFTGLTSLFSSPIATVNAYNADGTLQKDENGNVVKVKGMIDLGGFDFSKTEDDLYILSCLKKYDYDVDATDEYLRNLWGEDYDTYAEKYQLEDVYKGKYHGKGEDLTDDISAYLSKMYSGSQYPERQGCVAVDQELAEILQKLMDKYTFSDVDHSWTKLCYYYDYLGPAK